MQTVEAVFARYAKDGVLQTEQILAVLQKLGLEDGHIRGLLEEVADSDGRCKVRAFLETLFPRAPAEAVQPTPPEPPRADQLGPPGHPNRGLSVSYLAGALWADLAVADGETVADVEPRIRRRGEGERCPRDGRPGAAYVDVAPDPYAGLATHMLSYTWGYKVSDVTSALTNFCRRSGLQFEACRVWMCCFCVNQFRVREMQERGEKVSFEAFRDTFRERVLQIRQVLALLTPWDDPANLKRLWCVFELHFAISEEECSLSLIMPGEEHKKLEGRLVESTSTTVLGGMASVFGALGRVRVQDAGARYEDDRRNILGIVAPGVPLGGSAEQRRALAQACRPINAAVQQKLQEWLVETSLESLRGRCLQSAQEARRAYREASEVLEQCGSRCTVVYANVLAGMAILLDQTGGYAEQLGLLKESIATFVACQSTRTVDYANALKLMGFCYTHLGMHGDARMAFRESKTVFEECKATDNVWYLDLLTHNACSVALMKFEEAKSAFESCAATSSPHYQKLLAKMEKMIEISNS